MELIDIARKALAELSRYIDCGCVPCHGQCWSQEALREEIASRCDVARDALRALEATPASSIRCDEPSDVFTRVTRDMARSA